MHNMQFRWRNMLAAGALAFALSLGMSAVSAAPAWADNSVDSCAVMLAQTPGRAAAPAAGSNAGARQTYLPCGVKYGASSLKPGLPLPEVFGIAGPPDSITPMRSKSKKPQDDYVSLNYYSRFNIHIKDNVVVSIDVEDINAVMDGIPFTIGDKKDKVLKLWGQPDRPMDDMGIYWYRGVYVVYDKAGSITNLFLTAPGKSN